MSNFKDQYHDKNLAALFEEFYATQPPQAQARLGIWVFVAAADFLTGSTHPDTALEMAQAFIWSLFSKDMKQFTSLLKG